MGKDTTTGASGGKSTTGRNVSGGASKAGNRSGPYVPPAKRRGKNHQNGGRGTRPASEGAQNSNGNPRPQNGPGPKEGTPKPGNNSNNNKNKKSNHKNSNNTRNHGGQRLKVYSLDDDDGNNSNSKNTSFWQMRNDCKAVRYKVHKPRCDCPKLSKMVQHQTFSDELNAVTLEDGSIDALVVIPDTKQKYIYVCRDTPLRYFEDDPIRAEVKLRDELFPKTAALGTDNHDTDATAANNSTGTDESEFKLSCASCLLKAHEPNGFALIASSSASVVETIRDTSRSNQREKNATGLTLHQDHAHFVARLSRSSLWNLYRSKTRAQKSSAVDEILGHLSNQDIDEVCGNPEKFTDGIKLGHHLTSVLALTGRSDDFWFVMGYDDHKYIELDLPGGKRHLGETGLEGAIRETEEETSLLWDASWVKGVLQSNKRSDGGNRYFVLHPPQSLL